MKKNILLVFSIFIVSINCLLGQSFTSNWNTTLQGTSGANAIEIPTNPAFTNYNYTVDWGDGMTDTGVTGNITHTYTNPGAYTISISGTFPAIYFNDAGDRRKIIEITDWGNIQWGSMENAFYGCENLNFDAIAAPDLSQTTSLRNMFRGCITFNGILNNWDVSNVTDISAMFMDATIFNRPLDNWTTNMVTNMSDTFNDADDFNEPLDSWTTNSVTTMARMFNEARAFNQNINSWNTAQVTDMSEMFKDTPMNFPLNNWVVDNVTTMSGMFNDANYNQPIDSWDTSNVTDMSSMFQESQFNQPLSTFVTDNVTTMFRMFRDNEFFDQPINNWNVSNVTNMAEMFGGSAPFDFTVFNQPLDMWDVSNVTNMSGMFKDSDFFNQPIGVWEVQNVTNMSGMFDGAKVFNQPLDAWTVTSVENMSTMFEQTPLFNQPLNSWTTTQVTNMSGMFNQAAMFNQVLDNWNTSSTTNMSSMFRSAATFNQDLGVWDISQVSNMNNMLSNSGISEANYNAILIGWESQTVQTNVTLGAANLLYCDGRFARQDLIDNSGWTINDDIINCSFVLCTPIVSPVDGDVLVPANFNLVWDPVTVATGYRLTVTKDTGGTVTTVLDNEDVGNITIYDFPVDFTPGDIVTALVVPFNAEGPAENCETISFTIVAPWNNSPDAFKLTFNTSVTGSGSSAANQLRILRNSSAGPYNYAIDWGDGQYNNNVNNNITHTYETPGTYQIAIIGDYPAHYYNSGSSDARKLVTIDQWGTGVWQSMRQAFAYCENMTYNASDVPNLTEVEHMGFMFYKAENFNGNIENWVTTNVTNMSGTFAEAESYDQPLNGWDVSNVTTMSQMFAGDGGGMVFNQPLDMWDVSNVTTMYFMFYFNTLFNQPLNSWDVDNATTLGFMFGQTESFNQPLDMWNVNNVTDFGAMFISAIAFNQNIENWETGMGINMRYMFFNADSFNQPLNDWNVSSVTDMEFMFAQTELFDQPLDQWITSSLTKTESMFERTNSFNNDISTWNMSSVTNTKSMFEQSVLFNQDISGWNVTNVLDMESMFKEAESFDQPLEDWDTNSVVTMESMFEGAVVFNQQIVDWDVSAVATMTAMFRNAQLFDQPLDLWDTSSVTQMNSMFENAQVFNQNINDWDVSSVTSFNSMFQSAQLFDMPLDDWETNEALNMAEMFRSAAVFNQNIDTWNTSFVTTMEAMFQDATAFNQPLASWNTASVNTMEHMFDGASIFDQDIDAWNTRDVLTMEEMFYDAIAFNQPLNNWRVPQVTTMEGMFRNAESFNQTLDEWDLEQVTLRSMFRDATAFDQYLGDWNMTQVTNLNDMLDNSGMSRMNYDNTLIAWAEQTLPNNLNLGAQNVPYCDAFEEREEIIATYGWTFTGDVLDCPIPECTQLISPLDGDIDVPVNTNLTWEPAVFARGYRLTVVSVPPNANNVVDLELINQTAYNFSNDFVGGEVVTVTIIPFNDEGDAMGCAPENFTIISNPTPTVPDCTLLVDPLNGATDVPVETDLTWNPVSNADGYKISVGTTIGGVEILDNFNVGNITTFDLLADLPENTLIYVTITPFNEEGDAVNCTEESFMTEFIPVPPGCTALSNPLDDAIDVLLDTDLTWTAVPEATGYLLSVGTTPGGIEVLNAIDVGPMTTYDFLVDLDPGDTYYVRIIPYNNVGDASGCIEESFTTEIPSNVIAMCTDITVQLDATGAVTIVAADVDGGSSDPDGPVTLSLNIDTFNCSNIGENTVILTVTDNENNTASCQAIVTVEDNIAPTIDCLPNQTEEISTDCMFTIPDYTMMANIQDNCGNPSITQTPVAGTQVAIGTTAITIEVTDGINSATTCSFDLIVEDTTPPSASCVAAFTLPLDAAGMASITIAEIDNGSMDVCGVSLALDITDFTCDDIGDNTITLTVTDVNGLESTCTTVVTITDPEFACNEPPVAVCQAVTVSADEDCMAIAAATDFDGGSTDLEGEPLTFQVMPAGPYPLGITNVTLTVSDGVLTSSCMTTITVEDNTPPTLTCPENQQEDADASCSFIVPDYTTTIMAMDNCNLVSVTQTPAPGAIAALGETTVTITADDGTNTNSCDFTITVSDVTPPMAVCQDITVQLDAMGSITINAADIDGGSTDNCGNVTTSIDISSFDCSTIGANMVTLTATDDAGLTDTCTAIVTVEDIVAPEVICQDITIQLDDMGMASITASDIDGGSTDNCAINTVVIDISTFDCSNLGDNTVTLEVTDVNGNTDSCTATVTVEDPIVPIAACQNITIQLDDMGLATITPQDIDNGSTDNCDSPTLTLDNDTFDCSNIGENQVILTITDGEGNQDSCIAIVTVEDVTSPMPICQNIELEINEDGDPIIITPDMIDNGSTDNCAIASYDLDITTFDCSNLGDNEVVLTVTDTSGNEAICTATVTINAPTGIPEATCQNVTVVLDADGMATILPENVASNNSNDICGNTLTLDIDTFTCDDAGEIIPVTLTVTNATGESASCVANVFVVDNITPTITCPEDVVIIAALTPYELPDFVDNGTVIVQDNCMDQLVITQDPAAGTFVDEGETEINITVTDPSGNMVSCEFDIFVDPTLSTSTSEILTTIQLFPNPTVDSFSLSNTGAFTIENITVLDITGRKVKSFSISEIQENSYSVSEIASASYFILIETTIGIQGMQLIKK